MAYPVINLLGPGKRLVIWVQGCSRRCYGCISPELFKQKIECYYYIENIFNLLPRDNELNGITVTGGEPFEQAESLYNLLKIVRDNTQFDIMVYSGCTIENIRKVTNAQKKLLSVIDILIDGEYKKNYTNVKIWRGSDNQRVFLLTENAQKFQEHFNQTYSDNRQLLFQISNDRTLYLVGIPDKNFDMSFRANTKQYGVFIP